MVFKTHTLLILLTSLMFITINAQTPNGSTSNPDTQWSLIRNLSDEFNETNINWKKWSQKNNLPNTKAWEWNNITNVEAVKFQNENAAKITARHNENNKANNKTYFNSGCLQSKKQLPRNFEGYVEARIYGAHIYASEASGIDKYRGVCPSFWLYSSFYEDKAVGEAIYTEIDIVELQQFDYDVNAPQGVNKQDQIDDAESNLHLVKKTNNGREWFRPKQPKARDKQLNKYHLGFDPTQGWHTYGCEITPTKLYFYVDGKQVGKVLDNTYWSDNPMYIISSLGMRVPFVSFQGNAFNPVNPIINSRAKKNLSVIPASMYVDYIRVWKTKY